MWPSPCPAKASKLSRKMIICLPMLTGAALDLLEQIPVILGDSACHLGRQVALCKDRTSARHRPNAREKGRQVSQRRWEEWRSTQSALANQCQDQSKHYTQGRPQLRLQKSYQFQVPKTNPKTSPLYLLVSIMTIFPFLLCWWKRSRFQSLQSRRFEARRGLAEATPRTQHVLAQGQSEAHGDSKLYNTIVEVPARLNLK